MEERTKLEDRLRKEGLFDTLSLIDEIESVGAKVDQYGCVTVFHRTSPNNADEILKTRVMKALEDGIFFSTKKSGYNEGYGDAILEFLIPAEKLVLDDIFVDEARLRLPLWKKRSIDVSGMLIGKVDDE